MYSQRENFMVQPLGISDAEYVRAVLNVRCFGPGL